MTSHQAPTRADGSLTPTLAAVLLTRGDREMELARALDAVAAQRDVEVPVVLVANGSAAPEVTRAGVTVLTTEQNLGIPGGRNHGLAATTADVVLFLDDDGWLADSGCARRVAAAFAADPRLGIVSFRIADPVTGETARRHVPRLRAADPLRSGTVTTFLGGACAIRREVFERCGDLPAAFFYAHEETDLAWRALDAGFSVRYDAEVVLLHPAHDPATRHAGFSRHQARNRVWLARRRLPWPLVPIYLAVWAALTAARTRSRRALLAWAGGFVDGWRQDPGERAPMSWRTVARMTRWGRPPII